MNPVFITEVCVGSVRSALEAARGGAQRVELCENLLEGGTTPSAGSIYSCRAIDNLKTMVMIRPRGGDFLYTDSEFEIMIKDVAFAHQAGVHGVVFGILTADGRIDRERMARMVDQAKGLDITCHRAFDMTRDPFEALETLIDLGIKRVLTSGHKPKAPQGKELINKLVQLSAGRISIMPGSGVNELTVGELLETGATEFHIAPKKTTESKMSYFNNAVNMGLPDLSEYEITITDAARVTQVVNILKNHSKTIIK